MLGLSNYNRAAVRGARLGYGELVKEMLEKGADYIEISYHSDKRWYSGIVKV